MRSLKEVPLERLFFFPSNVSSPVHSLKKVFVEGTFENVNPVMALVFLGHGTCEIFFLNIFFFLLTSLECRSPLERPVVNNVLVSYNTVPEVNNVLVSHNTVRRPVGNNELGLFNTVITSFLGNHPDLPPGKIGERKMR